MKEIPPRSNEEAAIQLIGSIIATEFPEDLESWQLAGPQMVKSWLDSGREQIEPKSIPHAPGAAPDWSEVAKWIQVALGCINTFLALYKFSKDREAAKANNKKADLTVDVIEQRLKKEFEFAGLPAERIQKIAGKLAAEFKALL